MRTTTFFALAPSIASAVLTLLGAQGSDAAALPGGGKKNYYHGYEGKKWDGGYHAHGGKYHKRDYYDLKKDDGKKYDKHHYDEKKYYGHDGKYYKRDYYDLKKYDGHHGYEKRHEDRYYDEKKHDGHYYDAKKYDDGKKYKRDYDEKKYDGHYYDSKKYDGHYDGKYQRDYYNGKYNDGKYGYDGKKY